MNTMDGLLFKPIGIIHSPFTDPAGTPIQPTASRGIHGQVEVFTQFTLGLKDLDGFTYIILLYHFNRVREVRLEVKPFLDDQFRGVFATRAPVRPNPIGLSVVRLVDIRDNVLEVADIDILDSTPLLDLKPYVDKFDGRSSPRQGWLEENIAGLPGRQDDGRFTD